MSRSGLQKERRRKSKNKTQQGLDVPKVTVVVYLESRTF